MVRSFFLLMLHFTDDVVKKVLFLFFHREGVIQLMMSSIWRGWTKTGWGSKMATKKVLGPKVPIIDERHL